MHFAFRLEELRLNMREKSQKQEKKHWHGYSIMIAHGKERQKPKFYKCEQNQNHDST